ncbi:unnamed protein product [Ceratitis capitata]|uniref:(Mediterranean fruit fly) hypothetical protein n=1 Tax=Ceratitis capitata TaxID=7213 RepID=A0A811UBI1_CERCA|nr:unnamed protein product [Ceratitis capitata]
MAINNILTTFINNINNTNGIRIGIGIVTSTGTGACCNQIVVFKSKLMVRLAAVTSLAVVCRECSQILYNIVISEVVNNNNNNNININNNNM